MAIPNTEVSIIDVKGNNEARLLGTGLTGEICVRGPQVSRRYQLVMSNVELCTACTRNAADYSRTSYCWQGVAIHGRLLQTLVDRLGVRSL